MSDQPQYATERAVIGCILTGNERSVQACIEGGLRSDWFADIRCRDLYDASLDLFGAGKSVDAVTVPKLAVNVEWDFCEKCIDEAGFPANVPSYVHDLELEYKRRSLSAVCMAFHNELMSSPLSAVEDIQSQMQADVLSLALGAKKSRSLYEVGMSVIDSWQNEESDITRIPWPLSKMNLNMAPITDEFIVIAARPSVGKTALALQFIIELASHRIKASLASLESSLERIIPRLIQHIGNICTLPMIRGEAPQGDYDHARSIVESFKDSPMAKSISDTPMTVEKFRAFCMREKANGSKIIFADNLKHFRWGKKYSGKTEAYADICGHIKQIRDDLKIPIVLLHHLNKEMDLSWSDDIERDADIFIRMELNEDESFKPTAHNDWKRKDVVDVEIVKNRDGEKGFAIKTEFFGKYQKFEEEITSGHNFDPDAELEI